MNKYELEMPFENFQTNYCKYYRSIELRYCGRAG